MSEISLFVFERNYFLYHRHSKMCFCDPISSLQLLFSTRFASRFTSTKFSQATTLRLPCNSVCCSRSWLIITDKSTQTPAAAVQSKTQWRESNEVKSEIPEWKVFNFSKGKVEVQAEARISQMSGSNGSDFRFDWTWLLIGNTKTIRM